MGVSHFSLVSSAGVPLVGGGWPVPFGTKSKVFFIDPVNGNDASDGTSLERAVAKVSRAHALMTSGNNDVAFLIGNGLTSGTARETATITWSKDACHLIGVCSANHIAQRARISPASGTSDVTPIMTVSGDGCRMENLHLFQNFDTDAANVCLNVTGERNAFVNCHFAGGGDATGADNAGMRSVVLDGVSGSGLGENYFFKCVVGLDTINRGGGASAEIEVKNASPRNMFEDCIILAKTDAAAARMLTIGTSGMDRWLLFKNCLFWNDTTGGTTAMTEMLDVPADVGGTVMLWNCSTFGATAVEDTNHGQVYMSQETDTVADVLAV